jgi:hypothetical protein
MHDAVLYGFLFLAAVFFLFGRRAAAILFGGVILLAMLFVFYVVAITVFGT